MGGGWWRGEGLGGVGVQESKQKLVTSNKKKYPFTGLREF